jgi:hypothetical protein
VTPQEGGSRISVVERELITVHAVGEVVGGGAAQQDLFALAA